LLLNVNSFLFFTLKLSAGTQEFVFQVAEWTDEFGFSPVAAKYVRLRPGSEIEKNRTYIVTTIVVSTASETISHASWHHKVCEGKCIRKYDNYVGDWNDLDFRLITECF
jgi:hypothetical protein